MNIKKSTLKNQTISSRYNDEMKMDRFTGQKVPCGMYVDKNIKTNEENTICEIKILPNVLKEIIYEYIDPYKEKLNDVMEHLKYNLTCCLYSVEYDYQLMDYYEIFNIHFSKHKNLKTKEYLNYINKYICDTDEYNFEISDILPTLKFKFYKRVEKNGHFFNTVLRNISVNFYGIKLYRMFQGIFKFGINKKMLKLDKYRKMVENLKSMNYCTRLQPYMEDDEFIFKTFYMESFKTIIADIKKNIFDFF
jgi:hypothetical protein